MTRIVAAESELAARESGAVLSEPEREHFLGHKALVHEVVPGGNHTVDGDIVETEPEDPVELAGEESDATLLRDLSKVLVHDGKTADGKDVVRHKTVDRAGPVSDSEVGVVGLVSLGMLGVVAVVGKAGSTVALVGRNPEVAAPSVEDHLEALDGCAEEDGTVVLDVVVVGERNVGVGTVERILLGDLGDTLLDGGGLLNPEGEVDTTKGGGSKNSRNKKSCSLHNNNNKNIKNNNNKYMYFYMNLYI